MRLHAPQTAGDNYARFGGSSRNSPIDALVSREVQDIRSDRSTAPATLAPVEGRDTYHRSGMALESVGRSEAVRTFAARLAALEQDHVVYTAQEVEQHSVVLNGEGLMNGVQRRVHHFGQALLSLAREFLSRGEEIIAVDDPTTFVPFAAELGVHETMDDPDAVLQDQTTETPFVSKLGETDGPERPRVLGEDCIAVDI